MSFFLIRATYEFRVHHSQLSTSYPPKSSLRHPSFLVGALWAPWTIPPNKNREACLSRLPCDYRRLSGGSDETRTRDLRRDRPSSHQIISTTCLDTSVISIVVRSFQFISVPFDPSRSPRTTNKIRTRLYCPHRLFSVLTDGDLPYPRMPSGVFTPTASGPAAAQSLSVPHSKSKM